MQQYKDSINFIINRRQKDILDGKVIYTKLINASDGFYNNEKNLRIALQKNDLQSIATCQTQQQAYLLQLGITEKDINPSPHCTLCSDSCFVNSKICDCVKLHYVNNKNTNIQNLALNSFDTLKLDFYSDPQEAKKHIDTLKTFCNKFPSSNKKLLLLYGNTGTGKTHLASCVANTIINKGYSVIFCSSYSFFNSMQAYHTTFDITKIDNLLPYLDTDLLILDDLGTEIMLQNITVEYLYLLISERTNNNKHTIITTNLTINNTTNTNNSVKNADYQNIQTLYTRYGVRIASRLLDKNNVILFNFLGKDNRKISKL